MARVTPASRDNVAKVLVSALAPSQRTDDIENDCHDHAHPAGMDVGKMHSHCGIALTIPAPHIKVLTPADVGIMRQMLVMFSDAFGDPSSYCTDPPSDSYHQDLLASGQFISLAATAGDEVVGGLAAYQLRKFEQERTEVYIYDLAVVAAHRRQGIATALIGTLRSEAAARGAYVIYVQADRDDAGAVALYAKFGRREEVFHFDIAPS